MTTSKMRSSTFIERDAAREVLLHLVLVARVRVHDVPAARAGRTGSARGRRLVVGVVVVVGVDVEELGLGESTSPSDVRPRRLDCVVDRPRRVVDLASAGAGRRSQPSGSSWSRARRRRARRRGRRVVGQIDHVVEEEEDELRRTRSRGRRSARSCTTTAMSTMIEELMTSACGRPGDLAQLAPDLAEELPRRRCASSCRAGARARGCGARVGAPSGPI